MSRLDRIRERLARRGDSDVPEGLTPADKLAAQTRRDAGEAVQDSYDRELLAQRDRLAERFTMMQADLGGVFYEMAIRDHVRMEVLTHKAAELQRVDAELAEVDRLLRGEDGPPAGNCPSCAAPHGAYARFCSRCGTDLSGVTAQEVPADPASVARTNGSTGAGG